MIRTPSPAGRAAGVEALLASAQPLTAYLFASILPAGRGATFEEKMAALARMKSGGAAAGGARALGLLRGHGGPLRPARAGAGGGAQGQGPAAEAGAQAGRGGPAARRRLGQHGLGPAPPRRPGAPAGRAGDLLRGHGAPGAAAARARPLPADGRADPSGAAPRARAGYIWRGIEDAPSRRPRCSAPPEAAPASCRRSPRPSVERSSRCAAASSCGASTSSSAT